MILRHLSLRRLAMALALAAAPLSAQEQTWNPDDWTPEGGWQSAPIEGLPPGEEMLRDQLGQGAGMRPPPRPGSAGEDEDPLVMVPVVPPVDTGPSAGTASGGAILRGLDRVSGKTVDMELAPGQSATFGRIEVTLRECRYPADNPSSDAYALIEIADAASHGALFAGWMLASSPALNPLDHPRYDVWVLRCKSA